MSSPTPTQTETQPSARTALLSVRGVSRRFGGAGGVTALDDVSLDIADNEFFALLGPSGCGKTTLLRSVAGFEHPDAGSITLGGTDLLALPPHRRPVNLMFQSYALFPHLSVAGNVAYGLERERRPKAEVARRVEEVLTTVGLAHLARRRPAQLSGGQRQRVALARAIVKRPRLLLLDEPLSALDRQVRGQMQLELKRLQHEVGITFVVVTHDQDEAMSMADRVAVMRGGTVEQVAPPTELYRRPATLFVASFVGASNLFAGRAAGGVFVTDTLGALPTSGATLPAASPGGGLHLVVRPEDVRLLPPGGEGAALQGVVRETSFHGASTTVAVDVPGHPAGVLASVPGAGGVERGAPVGLTWTTAAVVPSETPGDAA